MKTKQALTQTQHTSARGIGVTRWAVAVSIALMTTVPVYAASEDTVRPQFAVLIVTYLFIMGVTQAGVVFSAVTRLSGGDWARPYYRIAELSTMAFAPFAFLGLLLIYFLGRDELFYWLSPAADEHLSAWLNGGWLLARNLFGLSLFYGVSGIYFWKSLQPDLEQADRVDKQEVQRQLNFLSPMVLAAFVICNTLIAWDFAMMLVPHWHSTVFPIHYWFGNVYAGTAALLAIPVVLGRFSAHESLFGIYQIRSLSMVISGFMLLWLYFLWAQFFVMWFGNLPRETDTLFRQMYGHYAPFYWTMIAGCFFIPFIALVFAVINRSLLAMCVLALGINLAIWINKYLMVIPVFSAEDRLLDHLLDLALSVGLLISFIAALVLLARKLPVYCYWEIKPNTESAVSINPVPVHSSNHS